VALILVVISVAWVPSDSAAAPRTPAREAALASYLGPEIIISQRDSEEHLPAIAYNSKHNEYLVAWENDWGGGYHDVYAQRLSATGRLLSWFALTTVHTQTSPAVAYDPDNDRYLVVWAYDSNGNGSNWDVYGRFVPWNGPPDLNAFPICDWPSNQQHPAVTYNGVRKEYLVVWKDAVVPSTISARRVLAGGGFPAGGAWTLSPTTPENRDSPDVAYNLHRNEYLVTWDIEINPADRDIRGIRLRGDGAPLTGGSPPVVGEFRIADYIDANEWTPAVAACAAADQYLVAWQSDQGTAGANHAIYARYLNGDAAPGNIKLIDDTIYQDLNVDVDCNLAGNRYVLASQTYIPGMGYGIRARMVLPSQTLSDTFWMVAPGQLADRVFPAVGGGRVGFLVAWEHQRDTTGGNRDIHGRLIQYAVYLPLLLRNHP
jgi:hypothetical protein